MFIIWQIFVHNQHLYNRLVLIACGVVRSNSVGMLLVAPLFVDLSHSESREIGAFQERNKIIDGLTARRC